MRMPAKVTQQYVMPAQAYMQGLDADASNSDLIDKRTEAETALSSEQIEAVMSSLYGAGRSALINGSAGSAAQPTFVVNMSLTFPQVEYPGKILKGTSLNNTRFIFLLVDMESD